MIFETYRDLLERAGRAITPLNLRIHNEIPLGMGFGSSAAALLAGVYLANHFGELGWDQQHAWRKPAAAKAIPTTSPLASLGYLTVSTVVAEASVTRVAATCGQATALEAACSRSPRPAWPPRRPARFCPPSTAAPMSSPTSSGPRCWSRPSRRAAAICSASPCRTVCTSPIAWRPARCCPACCPLPDSKAF